MEHGCGGRADATMPQCLDVLVYHELVSVSPIVIGRHLHEHAYRWFGPKAVNGPPMQVHWQPLDLAWVNTEHGVRR